MIAVINIKSSNFVEPKIKRFVPIASLMQHFADDLPDHARMLPASPFPC
jgi:hypothetical protein